MPTLPQPLEDSYNSSQPYCWATQLCSTWHIPSMIAQGELSHRCGIYVMLIPVSQPISTRGKYHNTPLQWADESVCSNYVVEYSPCLGGILWPGPEKKLTFTFQSTDFTRMCWVSKVAIFRKNSGNVYVMWLPLRKGTSRNFEGGRTWRNALN